MTVEQTIHLVDDEPDLLYSMAYFLESSGYQCRSYSSASEFLDKFNSASRGCIILDIRMPGMSGAELFDILKSRGVSQPVIFFSGHGDLPTAVRLMSQGAFYFLEKPLNKEVFLGTIDRALVEDRRRSQGLMKAESLVEEFQKLSPREKDLLRLIRQNLTNRQIAERWGLSERTVENYRANAYRKLRVKNLPELLEALDIVHARLAAGG